MINTIILLAAWWTTGQALLGCWRQPVDRYLLALPLGLSLSVTMTLMLWMGGVPVGQSFSLTWIAAVVSLVYLLTQPKQTIALHSQLRLISRRIWAMLGKKRSAVTSVMGGIIVFSLAILIAWQAMVQPVTWDNLTLYDFRAQRLAEGWLPAQFQSQFPGNTAYGMYDFLHPFFSSTLAALIYVSGGTNVWLVYGALLLIVLLQSGRVFHSTPARFSFLLLLLASPIFFQAAVEGYAVWLATIYWGTLLLWVLGRRALSRADLMIISLLLVSAMQCRLSEPYWLFFLVWFGWRRWLVWIGPLASFFPWQKLVQQAAQQSATGIVRSPYSLNQFMPTLTAGINGDSLLTVMKTLLFSNPILPYFGWLFFTLTVGWSVLTQPERRVLISWLWLVGLWSAMLLVGMLGLYLWNPVAWPEVQLALMRAGLPLALLLIILAAWVIDRLPIDPDLVS